VPALNGYCPVALLSSSQWVEGQPEFAIRHRGRVYFLSSQEAAQKFLANPDSFCPVLSGYDPLVLLRDGALVEGSVYSGLKDATQERILLFSSPENKKYFQENYDRLAAELDSMLKPVAPRTAATPASSLAR
jgi:protein disulfide-isomerase